MSVKYNIKALIVGLLAMVTTVGVTQAGMVVFSEDFEQYPANVSLQGRNPADGNANNWTVQYETGDQGARVLAGPSSGGSGANQRIGSYFRSAEASGSMPTMRRSFEPQKGKIEASFKIRIDDPKASVHQVILGSTSTGPAHTASRFRFSPNNFGVLGKRDKAGGTNAPIQTLIENVIIGNWYEVTIYLDPVAQTFRAKVRNLDNNAPDQSATSDELYFWGNTHTLDRWSAEQASVGPVGASFDDIVVRIPKSSSLPVLFGLLTAVITFFLRRTQK